MATRFSLLPAAIASAAANILAVVQSGVTRQVALSQIADWIVKTSASFAPHGNIASTTVQGAITEEVDDLAATSGSSLVGFVPTASAPTYGWAPRTVQAKESDTVDVRDVLCSDLTAVVCDGVHDDLTGLQAALVAAAGRTLVIRGTPLVSATWVINQKVRIVYEGGRGTSAGDKPSSYVLKKSTMTTPAIQITAADVVIEGGGVVSTTNATGGGITIEANGVTLRDFSAVGVASDGVGIRVGKDTAGANCNSWALDNCNSCAWGSHGIYIHDKPGAAPDANAGSARSCVAQSNSGDGIRCDNANLNIFTGCLGESNTGNGFSMGNTSTRSSTNQWCYSNHVIGGDYEANTAGQLVFNNSAYRCGFLLDSLTITVTDNGAYTANLGLNYGGRNSYTPGIVGSTGGDKSITGTSFAGAVCTATSAGHGYSNGDYVWIRAASNLNLNGVFLISNVTANTFDFTVRADATFLIPTGSVTATARKCGVYSTATGWYEYDKNKIFFQCEIVTTAITNIAGTVQLILPVPAANIGATSWGTVTLDYYAGITHAGNLRVLIDEAGTVNHNFEDTIGSGLTPAQLGAAGLAAATTIIASGWFFWR